MSNKVKVWSGNKVVVGPVPEINEVVFDMTDCEGKRWVCSNLSVADAKKIRKALKKAIREIERS